MRPILSITLVLTLPLGLTACPAPPDLDEEETSQVEGTTTAGPGMTSQADDDDDDDESEESGSSEEGETGCSFIDCPVDTDGPPPGCDLWGQDCPAGEKCMPWSNNGDDAWNALICVPVTENPGQPGDTCTVEGSGVSGFDDCDLGSMCWNVDGETNQGTCVAFCSGDPFNPSCDDPQTACVIANEGVLALCLATCQPLLQDCPEGEACYPAGETFTCAPDASGPSGTYGDPCEYVNVCDPGLFCATASAVPGCAGSIGCCSNFCDLEAPDPTNSCMGAPSGQECLPAYAEGDAPPGFTTVGTCALPSS